MNAPIKWPQIPALPAPGETVLMRVTAAGSRPDLRPALRQVLAAWSGLPPEQLPLRETSRGPAWRGSLAGHSLDISLSYAGTEGWIGLVRGAKIGLDALRIEPCAEAEEVARHYFDPGTRKLVRQSHHREKAFAQAWTALEARCKCVKAGLSEWTAERDAATARCQTKSLILQDGMVVAVAVEP